MTKKVVNFFHFSFLVAISSCNCILYSPTYTSSVHSLVNAEDRSNIFIEEGKQTQKINASQDANESEATVSVTVHEEKKNMIKTWTGTLVMIPLTIIINVFASSGNCYFAPGSFPHRSFFVAVAVNFYSSLAGVILWNTFRRVATGFLLTAFLSAMVSVTILFGETLQGELSGVPWILMIILILMVFYAGISSIVRVQE